MQIPAEENESDDSEDETGTGAVDTEFDSQLASDSEPDFESEIEDETGYSTEIGAFGNTPRSSLQAADAAHKRTVGRGRGVVAGGPVASTSQQVRGRGRGRVVSPFYGFKLNF